MELERDLDLDLRCSFNELTTLVRVANSVRNSSSSDGCTETLDTNGGRATSTILSASCARSSIAVSSRVEANTILTLDGSL